MFDIIAGAITFLVLIALLGIGLWVPFALVAVSIVALGLFTNVPIGDVMTSSIWGASTEWALAALPMFLWMGEILHRSRVSDDLFDGLAPWTNRIPGRLIHVNIIGSGLFAAVSGSSAATCATVGKISLPELAKRGYDRKMALGSLAGSATLGLLIPPSIILIVYGVAAEESIARLFLAGLLPGLMVIGLFVAYVVIWALLNPTKVPAAPKDASSSKRWRALGRLTPILLLIIGVIGSIYTGVASPTDAAAVGVALSLALSAARGHLSRQNIVDGLMTATRTSCMIIFILVSAAFLSAAMGYTGIPKNLAAWVGTLGLDEVYLIIALSVLFMILGCFLDGISIVVLTTAVILPIIDVAGIDRIWFGIYLVIVVEMSQITPPVGFNLFVIQNLTDRNILEISAAAFPFFLLLILSIGLILIFPEIATWLPTQISLR